MESSKYLHGCKTLHQMILQGKIERAPLWIDDYNKVTNEIAGTICIGISFRNHYYVSVYDEN